MRAPLLPSILLLTFSLMLCHCTTASAAEGSETKNSSSPENYLLSPQDRLIVSVLEDPNPSGSLEQVEINPFGEIHFRVSQGFNDTLTIKAVGKTLAQVKEEFKTKLDADYYQNATVALKLQKQAEKPGQVLFFGAVLSNFLPLDPANPRTVFEGVYQVGVNQFANLKKVKLHRIDPQTRRSRSWLIDLEAVKKGDRDQDVPLQDGDRIEVPERRIVF